MSKYVTAAEAVKVVKSGDRVYLQAAAAAPTILANALTERASELRNVEICHLHVEGEARYANPELADSFHVNSFFIGANVRHTLKAGNGSYTPVFLSELPILFRKNVLPLDVAFIHVSPPDKHGYCSLGVSVEATVAAIENAKIDYLVEVDTPIYGHEVVPFTAEEEKIGGFIASLIEDRSTLQMGIGSIPNAALSKLKNHKDLGLHTEMFSDGVIDLIEDDVINCNYKGTLRGRVLATFLMGSKRLYDFVNDNPFIEMKESSMVNDTARIRKNPKMVAINSAIEVDVTGQVCADSIGAKMFSGVGGQMDFIRGASLSTGGKAIIALPSVTKKGDSRIVPYLKQGAGVVTTRSHVHHIITENGIADLYGKTLKQRVAEMVKIAHPNHQEWIDKAYYEMLNSL